MQRSAPRQLTWLAPLSVLLAALGGPAHAAAARVVEHTLDNGLRVRIEVRPEMAEVGVAVGYQVGQRDAPAGYRGIAHLAEHLAFRGTRHLPGMAGHRTIADMGGRTGAQTSFDATVYHHAVPKAGLERALWVESDRMAFLAEQVDAKSLALEQDIVAAELRLRRGRGGEPSFFLQRAFPKAHPYYVSPDEIADVRAVDVPGLQAFLQMHYRPDLAALSVVGDVEPEAVLALVRRYFADIPRPAAPAPQRVTKAPLVPCYEVEGSIRGRGLMMLMWRTEAPGPPGALELLAALIESQVEQRVADPRVKVKVGVVRHDLETALTLQVRAPGTSLQVVRPVIMRVLGELGQGVVPYQVDKVRRTVAFDVARRLEAPTARAMMWVQSVVSTHPSPQALERGVTEVDAAEVLSRAAGLRGTRPDLWFELEGRTGKSFPKKLEFHQTPCRRL